MSYMSEADVCNAALHKVGGARIISLSDNTREGKLCKDIYPKALSRLLRSHPWGFATARAVLAELPDKPLYGYDKAYALPADSLRVLGIEGEENYPWEREGSNILTDNPVCKIKYIKKVTAVSLFPDDFGDALAGAIAVELSYALTSSDPTKQTVAAFAEKALREARSYNAQESVGDRLYADDWLNSRRY